MENPDDYVGDQAYQMYQELLDIVRNENEPEDETAVSDSTADVSRAGQYVSNMP